MTQSLLLGIEGWQLSVGKLISIDSTTYTGWFQKEKKEKPNCKKYPTKGIGDGSWRYPDL